MRTVLVRRTVLTASAVSLALLATACGGSDKTDAKAEGKPSGSASVSAAPEAKALTAAELEKAVLADGDVPKYKITPADAADVSKAADVKADKPACQPLALAGGLAPIGTVVAGTERIGAGEPTDPANPLSGSLAAVRLASYDGKGAADALASLKQAASACGSGFVVSDKGEDTVIKSVTPATAVGGDEAGAWTLVIEDEGETIEAQLVAVRKGSTLVTVQVATFTGKTQVPQDIVDAQLKKLG